MYSQNMNGRKKMDYKKMIIDMVNQINNKEALKIIHDFVMIPYNRTKLGNEGSNQHGLQKNDY